MNRGTRRVLALLMSISVWSLVLSSVSMATTTVVTPDPPAIRITPPAPVFDDAKRLAELAARRKHVADSIGAK